MGYVGAILFPATTQETVFITKLIFVGSSVYDVISV
jgi:hypothetical protein